MSSHARKTGSVGCWRVRWRLMSAIQHIKPLTPTVGSSVVEELNSLNLSIHEMKQTKCWWTDLFSPIGSPATGCLA
eukprot:5089257-Amphidinium_carterae.3